MVRRMASLVSSLLQCGRVAEDAESRVSPRVKRIFHVLQCGRVAEDAESTDAQLSGLGFSSLQCGRVAEDAESQARLWRRVTLSRFNVAASLRTRNPAHGECPHRSHVIASMWPRR